MNQQRLVKVAGAYVTSFIAAACGGIAVSTHHESPVAGGAAGVDSGGEIMAGGGAGGRITSGGIGGTSGDTAGTSSTAGEAGEETSTGGEGGIAGEAGTGGVAACVGALWSTYVQRKDGVLLLEGTSEQTILDSTTGLPLMGIASVQDGPYHGCAAVSDGSVQCWQVDATNGNASGQLGNGTTSASSALYRATPVLTAAKTALTDVSSVAQGVSNAACAVTNAGKLYCWGDLTWIVNNGTTLHTGYAQAITTDGSAPLADVQQVAIGYGNACALLKGTSTNEVWCWGSDGGGELGQSDTTARQYPIRVFGLENPTRVVMAPEALSNSVYTQETVCAVDVLGRILCWGDNFYGELGINSAANTFSSPRPVVTQGGAWVNNVVDIEPGIGAFAVVRSDGTLWVWGDQYMRYAANYGITNIMAIGYPGGGYLNGLIGPRYITSDGIYHSAMANLTVNCAAL